MTIETKIKFQDIVENQVPRFVRDDFPLLPDFLNLIMFHKKFLVELLI